MHQGWSDGGRQIGKGGQEGERLGVNWETWEAPSAPGRGDAESRSAVRAQNSMREGTGFLTLLWVMLPGWELEFASRPTSAGSRMAGLSFGTCVHNCSSLWRYFHAEILSQCWRNFCISSYSSWAHSHLHCFVFSLRLESWAPATIRHGAGF